MIWEFVATATWRLRVPGGWLYRVDVGPLTFVADGDDAVFRIRSLQRGQLGQLVAAVGDLVTDPALALELIEAVRAGTASVPPSIVDRIRALSDTDVGGLVTVIVDLLCALEVSPALGARLIEAVRR